MSQDILSKMHWRPGKDGKHLIVHLQRMQESKKVTKGRAFSFFFDFVTNGLPTADVRVLDSINFAFCDYDY